MTWKKFGAQKCFCFVRCVNISIHPPERVAMHHTKHPRGTQPQCLDRGGNYSYRTRDISHQKCFVLRKKSNFGTNCINQYLDTWPNQLDCCSAIWLQFWLKVLALPRGWTIYIKGSEGEESQGNSCSWWEKFIKLIFSKDGLGKGPTTKSDEFLEKFQGGGSLSIQKLQFLGTLKRAFWAWNRYKRVTSGFRVCLFLLPWGSAAA